MTAPEMPYGYIIAKNMPIVKTFALNFVPKGNKEYFRQMVEKY